MGRMRFFVKEPGELLKTKDRDPKTNLRANPSQPYPEGAIRRANPNKPNEVKLIVMNEMTEKWWKQTQCAYQSFYQSFAIDFSLNLRNYGWNGGRCPSQRSIGDWTFGGSSGGLVARKARNHELKIWSLSSIRIGKGWKE